ncbi:hypothetical protein CEXT_113711 [Caerostris extrusa]|uniref:Uncharacterized protein n=1 Tax=Caerostris extrusa TaxID=172846 RepID=A0AAV4QUK8_CAEEX|nr:hypothetical protein CEXT_113711 [Caerostris extrusa]
MACNKSKAGHADRSRTAFKTTNSQSFSENGGISRRLKPPPQYQTESIPAHAGDKYDKSPGRKLDSSTSIDLWHVGANFQMLKLKFVVVQWGSLWYKADFTKFTVLLSNANYLSDCCSIQNCMSSPSIKFRKNMFGIWDDKQLHINITFYRFYIYGPIYAATQLYRRKFPSIPKRGSTACKTLLRGCFTSEGNALWAPLSREGGSSEETGCISKDKLPGCRV